MKNLEKSLKIKNDLINIPIDRILDAFNIFSKNLLKPNCIINKKYKNKGVPFIIRWCQKENLKNVLNFSFGNYKLLDNNFSENIKLMPKGIVSHWIAGNVPTLGVLSIISSVLTKNISIIKLPSNSDKFFEDIFSYFSSLSPTHKKIYKSILTFKYDYKKENDLANSISKNSDTRIIWGGDESCKAIGNYEKKINVNDLVFHDRTSFIILDEEAITKNIKKVTDLIARDISVFEQLACASPHTVFIKTKNMKLIFKFCETLSNALEKYLKIIPKIIPSPSHIQSILNLRTSYAIKNKVWSSQGTEYSVFFDKDIKFGPNIGYRNIFCRSFSDIDEIINVIPKNVQTAGIQIKKKNKDYYIKRLALSGVFRFKNLGTMTNFEIPWDGIDIPRNLVNYISKT